MAEIYWEKDADHGTLKNKRIAVIGYGSQGKAHALNLRDAGYEVVLGLREGGPTWVQAAKDGWAPMTPGEAAAMAEVIAILVPDMTQRKVYEQSVAPNLKPGKTLLFAHGFNIHYGHITPPDDVDVVMIAPKSPGQLVRRQFSDGKGVPCLIAVHQDATGDAFDKALAYAHGLGGTRAGVLSTTFKEETETDLFGEQAVLCGGATELIAAGFDTLVEAGYQPEVAYFECLHELKLIVDLIYEGGFAKMHQFVSDTAKYGDLTRGKRVVDDQARANMKQVLGEIQDGTFAREWAEENESGNRNYKAMMDEDLNHPIELVGKKLRAHMTWLQMNRAESRK